MPTPNPLADKIQSHRARVAVIGLGYVGLPLAVEFAHAGFPVTGIEVDPDKVRQVNQGVSYIPDIPTTVLEKLIRHGRLKATATYRTLTRMDCAVICVPTPLRKTKEPDISFIVEAVDEIARYLHRGQLIILESTTYPGTTEEVILPRLEASGLKVGRDFYLAFSPERVDPGNREFRTRNIPKVVSGVTRTCKEMVHLLYAQVIQQVIPVSSPKVAETVKLLENTFRNINIGLANEFALLCDRLKINVWEVIDAARTKPFGFMPFYPGPGIGGHCIPLDPHYLLWKARLHGFEPRMIEIASQVNAYMPHFVVDKVATTLNRAGKPLKGSRIMLIGVAYKKDVSDTRESPAGEIMQLLEAEGARVSYHDPFVASFDVNGKRRRSSPLSPARIQQHDCIVIATNHSTIDYQLLLKTAQAIVDTRNSYPGNHSRKVVRL